ncbi:MAG: metal ABC transporter substrate-binding protein [Pseudomonadota bacterium]|nr:metal ABC transporter substrate-binding protein [Pseudomonadota bacterium]
MNRYLIVLVLLIAPMASTTTSLIASEPLRVVATVPDLGSIARSIGGDGVTVTSIARGMEDPHFVEARPSYIKLLNRADLYLQLGMDMETGWAPVLLENARNGRVLPGAPGYVDASTVVTPLEVPRNTVTRAMGDVHAWGNPHYLLDPVEGLKVAALIRDRLIALRPEQRTTFEERYETFANDLAVSLVGEELAARYGADDVVKLARLYRHGRLDSWLSKQAETALLGGWLGQLSAYRGTRAVDDHNIWPYFANTFGVSIIGHMEPKPGVPPTTRHLGNLIQRMKTDDVTLILTSSYYDPRHARFVSENTGAAIVPMAHQAGARPGTDDYLAMLDYNVQQLVGAVSGAPGTGQ